MGSQGQVVGVMKSSEIFHAWDLGSLGFKVV